LIEGNLFVLVAWLTRPPAQRKNSASNRSDLTPSVLVQILEDFIVFDNELTEICAQLSGIIME